MNSTAGYALAAVAAIAVIAIYLLSAPNWLALVFILVAGIGVVGGDNLRGR